MLDTIGSMSGMIAIAVDLVAIVTFLNTSLSKRLMIAAIFGAWVGLASAVSAAGLLAFLPNFPVPLIGVLNATPLVVVAILALTSASFRVAIRSIPTSVLIGINSMRVLGVLFLFLVIEGRLSGPFPYSAGLGDIITGLLALPLAMKVAKSSTLPTASIARWNIFGMLDLIVAIGLGITSANGSPVQIFHVGAGSLAMQSLPFSLVPTVLVPFYLITHGIIAARLMSREPVAAFA